MLEPHLPALEELYLSSNSLMDLPRGGGLAVASTVFTSSTAAATATATATDVMHPTSDRSRQSQFSSLRVLDVSGCSIENWNQLTPFADMPLLEELLLDGNPIENISPCSTKTCFRLLSRLSISSTKLHDWSDLDHVATYPSLTNIRLR